MEAIKSFVYLDEYKMYSLSSQIFEGLTESLTSYRSDTKEEEDIRDDRVEAGRSTAQNFAAEMATQERKYLHDYSYIRFESALQSSGRLMSISSDDAPPLASSFAGMNFVAVRGKAEFIDFRAIGSTMEKFNELGESMAYVTEIGAFPEDTPTSVARGQRQRRGSNAGGRNQRLAKVKERAKQNSMYLDPDYLRYLGTILEWGYRGGFDVSLNVGGYAFSATLQRQYFREPEDLIVKKYSRSTERDFVLVGAITQGPGDAGSSDPVLAAQPEGTAELPDPADIREGVAFINSQLHVLENLFVGKRKNEIIVDPIALYREM